MSKRAEFPTQLFSGETNVCINGFANEQYCAIWMIKTQKYLLRKKMHPKRVWCGFCTGDLVDLFLNFNRKCTNG